MSHKPPDHGGKINTPRLAGIEQPGMRPHIRQGVQNPNALASLPPSNLGRYAPPAKAKKKKSKAFAFVLVAAVLAGIGIAVVMALAIG